MPTHHSSSVAETEAIAADFARTLRPNDCVALDGQLGAGKTQFVRGLIRGLGGDERQVSSPTYVLLQIYETPTLRVYHIDAYRVAGSDDMEQIGFSELLDQAGIVVIEWPTRAADLLPARTVTVKIEVLGEEERTIEW